MTVLLCILYETILLKNSIKISQAGVKKASAVISFESPLYKIRNHFSQQDSPNIESTVAALIFSEASAISAVLLQIL